MRWFRTDRFSVRFPACQAGGKLQDEEYCIIDQDGDERKIRFHDYHEIYAIPGLYEYLFIERLKCRSPEIVSSLLVQAVIKSSSPVSKLSVLDIGAGNGIVGEVLKQLGIRSIVGIDIIPEAAEAAQRDRPGIYDEYHIEDLQNLSLNTRKRLEAWNFNCLVTVGALGFADIPPRAFAEGYNLIVDDGWIAFNIKEDFIEESDLTGFSHVLKHMVDSGILRVKVKNRYCHRLSVNNRPLYYVAVIGKKEAPIPVGFLESESASGKNTSRRLVIREK